jgi:hypothetical protein
MLNKDYKDILRAFSKEDVKFLLVGAYAMAVHGFPRTTMDIDLWIEPSSQNSAAVMQALRNFGAPLQNLTVEDLQQEDVVFQIGVAPCRIDVLTSVSGLKFNDAFQRSLRRNVEEIELPVLCIDDLIHNKRATGRTRDLADVEDLESLKRGGTPT